MKEVKEVIIEEKTCGWRAPIYTSKLVFKINCIEYKETTENIEIFPTFKERNYSYKYSINSNAYIENFNKLVNTIENAYQELLNGKRVFCICTDVGVNTIKVIFNNDEKIELDFYDSIFETDFYDIGIVIRDMIPKYERIPEMLMTREELELIYGADE